MTWLQILRLVLQVAARLAQLARNKRLMDVGQAHAVAASLTEQQGRVAHAISLRRKILRSQRDFPDRIRDDDGYRREK